MTQSRTPSCQPSPLVRALYQLYQVGSVRKQTLGSEEYETLVCAAPVKNMACDQTPAAGAPRSGCGSDTCDGKEERNWGTHDAELIESQPEMIFGVPPWALRARPQSPCHVPSLPGSCPGNAWSWHERRKCWRLQQLFAMDAGSFLKRDPASCLHGCHTAVGLTGETLI